VTGASDVRKRLQRELEILAGMGGWQHHAQAFRVMWHGRKGHSLYEDADLEELRAHYLGALSITGPV